MKPLRFLLMLMCIAAAVVSTNAAIVLNDPVIQEGYIEFTGVNEANNYKFVLNTYEWADRGPQFQLTITRIDENSPAQFTAADLEDQNYWEPMFKYYTKQIAGEEMIIENNLKRLYVTDVALLDGQFADYVNVHIIGINADGDFDIPAHCFEQADDPHLDDFDCHVMGNLTVGESCVPAATGFTLHVYTTGAAAVWTAYRNANHCHFIIDNQAQIAIQSVEMTTTVNGKRETHTLPEVACQLGDYPNIKQFDLDNFKIVAEGDFDAISLYYRVQRDDPDAQAMRYTVVETSHNADGTWKYEGNPIKLANGLDINKSYVLDFYIVGTSDTESITVPADNQQRFTVAFTPRDFCDVDGSGSVNVTDINLIVSAVLTQSVSFDYDLNADNQVNVSDVNLCVSKVLQQK